MPVRDLTIDLNLDKTFGKTYSELYKDTHDWIQRTVCKAESIFSRKL